jgi:hypothetical protein
VPGDLSMMGGSSLVSTRAGPVDSETPAWSEGSGSPWAGGHKSCELSGLSRAPLTGRKELQLFPV